MTRAERIASLIEAARPGWRVVWHDATAGGYWLIGRGADAVLGFCDQVRPDRSGIDRVSPELALLRAVECAHAEGWR